MSVTSLIESKGLAATTQRFTPTHDSGGALIQTFAQNLTGFKAFVQDISGNDNAKYGREAFARLANIYVGPGLDILEKDRLICNSRTFSIMHAETRTAAGNVYMQILGEEREGV